jgi:hypothetical protein
MSKISLIGLNKASVLAALYNASKPQGLGFVQYNPKPMTQGQAEDLLAQTFSFDYLSGRVMKVDLRGDELNTSAYDRDNGEGAAERAIVSLQSTGNTNSKSIQETHKLNTLKSANDTISVLEEESSFEVHGSIPVIHLGLSDAADELLPYVQEIANTKEETTTSAENIITLAVVSAINFCVVLINILCSMTELTNTLLFGKKE